MTITIPAWLLWTIAAVVGFVIGRALAMNKQTEPNAWGCLCTDQAREVVAREDYDALGKDRDRLRGLLRRGFAFSANCEADPEQPEGFRRKAAEWASEVQDALAGAADQPTAIPCPHPDVATVDGVCYCCGQRIAPTPTPQPDAVLDEAKRHLRNLVLMVKGEFPSDHPYTLVNVDKFLSAANHTSEGDAP